METQKQDLKIKTNFFDLHLVFFTILLAFWIGATVVMFHELATVRPNVLKILQGK